MEAACRCLEQNSSSQSKICQEVQNRSELKDSLLPLLVSRPELVDYEGQTIREAHGGHTGEEEDEDEDQTGGFEDARDREGDKTLLKRIAAVTIGPNLEQESPTPSAGGARASLDKHLLR